MIFDGISNIGRIFSVLSHVMDRFALWLFVCFVVEIRSPPNRAQLDLYRDYKFRMCFNLTESSIIACTR